MTVADIARMCLTFPNVSVADAPTKLPNGAFVIRSYIFGALGEMYKIAPQLFSLPKQAGTLIAPLTRNITFSADYLAEFSSSVAPIGACCTVRIAGQNFDHEIAEVSLVNGTSVEVDSGYLGATGTATACTVYHDAFKLRVITTFNVDGTGGQKYDFLRLGNRAWINGEPITRVASRQQARDNCRHENGRNATGVPRYWWHEQRNNVDYCCVYPMPEVATSLAVETFFGPMEIPEADIYDSDKTFGLEHDHIVQILLPLTLKRLMASPLFANPSCRQQVADDAKTAEAILNDLAPKKPREQDFRAPRSHPVRRTLY